MSGPSTLEAALRGRMVLPAEEVRSGVRLLCLSVTPHHIPRRPMLPAP